MALEFAASGTNEFTMVHGKNRMGGRKEPKRGFRVVDLEDESLAIAEAGTPESVRAREAADFMAEAISSAERGYLTTTELRNAAKAEGCGTNVQREAMRLLEDQGRARAAGEHVETNRGRQPAKVWRLLEPEAVVD